MSSSLATTANRTFAPEIQAAAAARSFVRDAFHSWNAPEIVDDAVLLTSELVTNAVVHAGTDVTVSCRLDGGGAEIAVRDELPQRMLLDGARAHDVDPEDLERDGGLGLALASAIASAWGVTYTQHDKTVWFRLDRSRPGTASAVPVGWGDPAPQSPNGLRVVSFRVDDQGRPVEWSDDAEAVFGWTVRQARERTLDELLAGRDPAPGEILQLARWTGVCEFRHSDGSTIPMFVSHIRTNDVRHGIGAVWLAVPEADRALLESPPRAPAAGPGAGEDPWGGLGEALRSRLSLDELLQHTVARARDAVGGDAAYVVLATSEESEWQVRAAAGLQPDPWQPILVRAEETFASMSPDPLPVIHDDLVTHQSRGGRLAMNGMRSMVTAPLIVDGRTTGLVAVASRRPRHFDREAAISLQRGADRIALPVERARLAEVELARRASLSFLAEASDLLAGTLDEDMTAALAAQLAVSRLGAWCAVHLIDDAGTARMAYVWHRDEDRIDGLRLMLDKMPAPDVGLVTEGTIWTEPKVYAARTGDRLAAEIAAGTAMSFSLVGRGRRLGTLTIGRQRGESFNREIADVAEDMSRRVASALDNARLYSDQANMSQALQRSLLPSEVPEIPAVDIALLYQPAGEGTVVGGDFYDLFSAGDHWCVAIGDVCGTGPEAAAVTGLARHTLRALAREGYSPPQILHRLNSAILEEGPRARFLTLIYGELSPREQGGMRLRLISAGHPLPMRVRPTGEVSFVAEPQPLLGAFDEVTFETETADFAPGDVLVCVTDGVTERRHGKLMLGDEGLTEILKECSGLTAAAVATRIERELADFAPDGHDDDTAILVLRFR
ncbi:MAG: SpoIIE family protein phosphatase [Streptosporangiales bacterium]|nr:SpoIIE family protein phosphatase [Streptosporangiales bacterium]